MATQPAGTANAIRKLAWRSAPLTGNKGIHLNKTPSLGHTGGQALKCGNGWHVWWGCELCAHGGIEGGQGPLLPQGQPDNCQLNVTLAETLPEASEMIVRMPSQESNLKHTHKKYICNKIIRANLSV